MSARERIIEARDGWSLSVLDLEPPGEPRAVVIAGHAMMVNRRTMYRPEGPSLATSLCEAGMRVLVPDLRGHGASGPGADRGGGWSYDSLIADVPVYLQLARELSPGVPVVIVGNSLFGHVSLAYLGTRSPSEAAGPAGEVDAIVAFAVNIWNRRWTPSLPRHALKLALVALSAPTVGILGRLPVKRLGLGSEDEPGGYWRSMLDWAPGNRWGSELGVDYAAGLANVSCPVLQVVSDGDRLLCHPDDGAAFGATLQNRELLHLGPACRVPELRGLRPGHVEMVHHPSCEPVWRWVASWILAKVQQGLTVEEGDGS
ncbi:alpha/beta hydrolase [Endomicrobium sp. AH-315-J14]|nr:alpha/beta hydrolase [Endomicrobium sp. AH-315-J14]